MRTVSIRIKNIRNIWVTVFILLYNVSPAQVLVQFVPALNGRTMGGLFMAEIQNASPITYTGKLKVTVKDAVNKTVLTALTPSFLLKPGGNSIQTLSGQARLQFGNSSSARILAETGRFPENDYEYCFEFTGAENKTSANERVFENCYNYNVQPVFPLSLINPGDGDAFCETRPVFTWQAAIPVAGDYLYKLIVVEKKDKQELQEALLNNTPLYQQDNIAGCVAHYPPQLPELQKDKDYAWQVLAYQGGIQVTQSEIWKFRIGCDDRKPDSSKESYRQLSTYLDGNYYSAGSTLRISLINPYGLTTMRYSLTDISDPTRKIENLPVIKIQTGLNKVDIGLEDISGLELNKMYRLKVANIGDHTQYLQFIYKGSGY